MLTTTNVYAIIFFKLMFLKVYADCLAQSIYTAFYEAFPESIRLFQEEFKQYLCEVATTWISGK